MLKFRISSIKQESSALLVNRTTMNSETNKSTYQTTHLTATCLYYSGLSDWRGGSAGLKSILQVFDRINVKTCEVISYSFDSNIFEIEQNYFGSIKSTTIHFPSNSSKIFKVLSLFFGLLYSSEPVKKSDFIFAHLSITSGIPAIISGKLFNKPVIFHYIDIESLPFFNKVLVNIFKAGAAVLVVSPFLTKDAVKKGLKGVRFLPPIVDTELFQVSQLYRQETRRSLGLDERDMVVGYVGSFSYIEGIPNLLTALASLSKKKMCCKLLIVGGKKGRRDDDVQRLVQELNIARNVVIVPPVDHDLIPKYLSACDITCCSKIDCEDNRAALPIKVVEYMSMGLPTVCSSVGGICDVIKSGEDGFLVKPGDASDLEEKLCYIIEHPIQAKIVGQEGRRKAIKNFSHASVQQMIDDCIKDVVLGCHPR